MSERFVVVGAGTMGTGIAYVAAAAGYEVEIVEVDAERAERAMAAVRHRAARAAERDARRDRDPGPAGTAAAGSAAARAAAVARRVRVVGSLPEVEAGPQVIVEAVPERIGLKHEVLAAAEQRGPALLGSNTSSISIDELAARLADPGRLIGLHFFNPVWAMALLEIVVGPRTSQRTRQAALDVAARLGKDPVVVRDMPGFATSRLGIALGLEAIRMVADGVAAPADIDKAMTLGYRHPMGPLELTDLVGLDVRLDIARTLQAAYGERFAPPPLLERMVAAGRLGRKSGAGFYRWRDGERLDDQWPDGTDRGGTEAGGGPAGGYRA